MKVEFILTRDDLETVINAAFVAGVEAADLTYRAIGIPANRRAQELGKAQNVTINKIFDLLVGRGAS